MSARDRIFARIRAGLGEQAEHPDLVSRALSERARGPLPRMEHDLIARFRARALVLGSTTDEIRASQDIPAAIARYLQQADLPIKGVCWPEYAQLDWNGQGLHIEARPAGGQDMVGITGVYRAIAETGTLMFLSGPTTPATTSLLPETHIAIVPAHRIVAHMEDAWDDLRRERETLPRAVNFVSGPSRTADIEQTVTLGAHGPYRVHIIVQRDRV